MVIEPGSVLGGRYRLEKEVGRGGFGVVFAATDTRTGKRVAVKTLTLTDKAARALFEQETLIPQMVEGHGIVPVLDRGEYNGTPFYVMPFLEGESLWKARKKLSDQQKVNVIADTLGTLSRVHQAGIVHRDIKPANIFIDKEGGADVIDFGLAQLPAKYASHDPGAGSGTPGYMAPEQAGGYRVGPEADVWAIGATAYDLFTGHPPQRVGEPLECPVFPLAFMNKELPRDLAGIIDRSLECDPNKRYHDAGEMLKYLTPHVREALRERETVRPTAKVPTNSDVAKWAPAVALITLAVMGVGGVFAVKRA